MHPLFSTFRRVLAFTSFYDLGAFIQLCFVTIQFSAEGPPEDHPRSPEKKF